MITEDAGVLPAGHGVVSVQHLFAQLAVLDPTGELNVSELITQQLWPQEALQVSSEKPIKDQTFFSHLFVFAMSEFPPTCCTVGSISLCINANEHAKCKKNFIEPERGRRLALRIYPTFFKSYKLLFQQQTSPTSCVTHHSRPGPTVCARV